LDSKNTYLKILASEDTYRTPAAMHKKFILKPKWYFFRKFIGIILESGYNAKRDNYNEVDWANTSYEMLQALEESGVIFSITGMHHLTATDSPVVFIGNHMSTLETVVLPSIIQPVKRTTFVVKAELMEFPVFRHVLATRGPVVVGRNNPREDLKIVLREGQQKLHSGTSIIIFPQRTRSVQFDPDLFNSLGVKLAQRSEVPVIPLALCTDAWENGRLIKEYGKINTQKTVRIAFDHPMEVTGNGTDVHQHVLDFIRDKLKEWGRTDCLVTK